MSIGFVPPTLKCIQRRKPFSNRRIRTVVQLSLLIAAVLALRTGQSTALLDAKGSKAACLGIGPIMNKCVKMAEDAGLIKENEVGETGLTFGISGKDDGHITEIVPAPQEQSPGFKWEI